MFLFFAGRFTSNYKITIGADFAIKAVDWDRFTKINLQLWYCFISLFACWLFRVKPCSIKHTRNIYSSIEVKSSSIRISPFTIRSFPRSRKKISFLLIITNINCYIFFNNFAKKMLIRWNRRNHIA